MTIKKGGVARMCEKSKLVDLREFARSGRAVLAGLVFSAALPVAAHAGDYYDNRQSRLDGFYVGALGQYTYANAKFRWDGETIFDKGSHNWGVGGVMGYGWLWDSFYFGPEGYFNYMGISNSASSLGDIVNVSIDRQVEAGVNLLAGFTGFDDTVLFYGLLGGGAANVSGKITVAPSDSFKADIWYPVLTLGGGIDWAFSPTAAMRFQATHTFYYDASDEIFSGSTSSQSYDLDTTTVSLGLIWRPWN